MRRAMLIAVVLCCLAGRAWSTEFGGFEWMTGNTLLDKCQRQDQSFCLGYVMGATAGSRSSGPAYCLSANVTGDQVKDVVMSWLRDHPEKRHLASTFLIVQALKEKFPCN